MTGHVKVRDDRTDRVRAAHPTAVAVAKLPTSFGLFDVFSFAGLCDNQDVLVVRFGDLQTAPYVPVRIHSQCLTGNVFRSLRCDCDHQLEFAQRAVVAQGCGVIVHLPQEGRGIGLHAKIEAYALQDTKGLDTFESNLALGFGEDLRDYACVQTIFRYFDIRRVQLMTNNRDKLRSLQQCGFDTVRIPVPCSTAPETRRFYDALERSPRYCMEA